MGGPQISNPPFAISGRPPPAMASRSGQWRSLTSHPNRIQQTSTPLQPYVGTLPRSARLCTSVMEVSAAVSAIGVPDDPAARHNHSQDPYICLRILHKPDRLLSYHPIPSSHLVLGLLLLLLHLPTVHSPCRIRDSAAAAKGEFERVGVHCTRASASAVQYLSYPDADDGYACLLRCALYEALYATTLSSLPYHSHWHW